MELRGGYETRINSVVVILLAGLVLLGGCEGRRGSTQRLAAPQDGQGSLSGDESDPVVATVDGKTIGASAVRKAMVRRGADFLARFSKLEEKQAVVEELIRTALLARAARQAGYLDDPEIRESIDDLLAEKYWRDQMRLARPPAATEQEARDYYDSHPAEFVEPVRVRGAVISLRWKQDADETARAAVRERAEGLVERARGMSEREFAALVRAESDDPATKKYGGDTGFILEGTTVYRFDPPVLDALFAAPEVGDIRMVELPRGVYVVRLTDRQGGEAQPFELVEAAIRRRLTADRRHEEDADRYAQLRRKADVRIDQQVLATVGPQQLAADSQPPSFPVGDRAP
jgi:peptidyl-prolyl cis-trans isomerase C